VCFLKKKEGGERERGRRRKGVTGLPLETDPSHFGPCGLQSTLVTNTLLDKCILFRPLIGTLCQKALKVCIDPIINCCSKSRVRHVCSAVSYRTRFRNRRLFYSMTRSYKEVIRRELYNGIVAYCASVN
jgi:hypothetical protein